MSARARSTQVPGFAPGAAGRLHAASRLAEAGFLLACPVGCDARPCAPCLPDPGRGRLPQSIPEGVADAPLAPRQGIVPIDPCGGRHRPGRRVPAHAGARPVPGHLAGAADPHDAGLRARRSGRHRRAHDRAQAHRTPRPAGDHREPWRRRRHGRHRTGRPIHPGRLHPDAGQPEQLRLRALALPEAGLRSGQGLRADLHRGEHALRGGDQSPRAREDRRRPGAAGQGQEGVPHVRLVRPRRHLPHRRRTARPGDRHAAAARALQGDRPVARRTRGRRDRHHDRRPRPGAQHGQGRAAARAGRIRGEAHRRDAPVSRPWPRPASRCIRSTAASA